jgi:hypothetical protein
MSITEKYLKYRIENGVALLKLGKTEYVEKALMGASLPLEIHRRLQKFYARKYLFFKWALIALLYTGSVYAGYEDAVKSRLNDPASAEFKDVQMFEHSGSTVYCGYVNAKNGFGGYGEWKEFISNGGPVTYIRGDVEDSMFVEVWNQLCR